ncbi:NAD(P)-binding domain-containing protein [Nocardia nepalensis]|uniref:NAD(P)-binding domain-containing protein n=1 Tax=Nocardia nepalensis TaxID=3375448 RepID=UPI003B675E9E
MDIALLGTGLMGSALAKGLLDTGVEVTVWNRTADKCAALAECGAVVAASPGAAVAAAPAVLISLLNYDVAKSVLAECGSINGKVIVNTATGSPEEANAFSEWVVGRGGQYLDGAIAAYPEDIGTENAGINYSGSEAAWHQVRALLMPIAPQSRFVGTRPGAANVLDAAMAGAFFNVALGAFHEAASYVRAEGVAVSEMSYALHLWTDKLLQLLREALTAFESREYATDQATLEIYTAAVESWRDSMVRAGQRAALMTANLQNLRRACEAGYGDQGLFAQIETLSTHATVVE